VEQKSGVMTQVFLFRYYLVQRRPLITGHIKEIIAVASLPLQKSRGAVCQPVCNVMFLIDIEANLDVNSSKTIRSYYLACLALS
jgi:hypothetical protein